jgi:hypothetical protein
MMENILVNVLDRPGGTVIYQWKYKLCLKKTVLLTTLRATHSVGSLKDSEDFDIADADKFFGWWIVQLCSNPFICCR